MSHPSPTGNGCSLEDCYTNLFALTDLGGIKWRKLTSNPDNVSVEQLEDPVLVSYARCIQSGLLCVWRRVVKNSEARSPEQLSVGKELWVFWYGDEPTGIDNLLSPDLKELEHGSWDKEKDKDSGLTYECRTLLFKALHNLIERCLLSKNFVRLGKWFVQPYDQGSALDRSAHLSFCFNFFLHGESQVCASIEVKQHPAVWRLTPQHVRLVQENHASFQVILAPYGLNGTLTGHTYRDTDQISRKMFEEWSQFYPFENNTSTDDKEKLPNLVEVIVSGVRMRYPASFVLICDNEDSPVRLQPLTVNPSVGPRSQFNHSMMSNGPLTPPTSPADNSMAGDTGVKIVPMTPMNVGMSEGSVNVNCMPNASDVLGHAITQKVLEDSSITTSMAKRTSDTSEELAAGQWHFAEPTSKVNCACPRQRKMKGGGAGQSKSFPSGKHKGEKQEKLERQQSRHGRSATPFHRRSPIMDDLMQFDIDLRLPPNPAFCPTGGTTIAPQGQSTPNETNVDTPSAPSPLDELQPLVNSTMDPPMPTLSPHPPQKLIGNEKEVCGKQTGSASENQNGFMCSGFPDYYPKNEEGVSKSDAMDSPCHWGQESKHDSVNNWLQSQHRQMELTRGLKRPSLPTKDADEEEELVTDSLYNMNSVQQWIDLPMKKVRIDTTPPDGSNIQQPSLSDSSSPSGHSQRHTPKPPTPPPAPDPYEFSDEASVNPGTLTRCSRKSRDEHFPRPSPKRDEDAKDPNRLNDSKDENPVNAVSATVGSPQTPGASLTREIDLKPTELDLEHIFESSGDDSDDAGGLDAGLSASKTTEELTAGKITPSAQDLSRMYPTPPSLENTKLPSPETMTDVTHDVVEVKVEAYPMPTAEELCKQGVFKPPEFGKFVGCGKYSQVELPSKQLSPIPVLPDYKPPWQFTMAIMDKSLSQPTPSQYINIPSIENIPSLTSRLPTGTVESSPATFHNSNQQRTPRTPRTPMSYELQSPASNASSILNKTLNSIDNHGTNNQLPEVHSLIVNVLLSDSILNLFKDHNFDSCNICVCNMDIKGSDAGLYVPDTGPNSDSLSCSCGFSAAMNRKYGYNSGLFYEDEVDITGRREDRFERRKPSLLALDENTLKDNVPEDIPQIILELLLGQFTLPHPSMVAEHRLSLLDMCAATSFMGSVVDTLQISDGNEVSYNALDQGRQAMENCSPNKLDDPAMKKNCLHKWPFLKGANRIPLNSQDILRMLKTLNPLLMDAIMNKRIMRVWEHSHKLTGPLSWKDFHQLADRGSDENSEPQPIPHFLVGYDRDWLSVSPFSIRFWDKEFMEPFGRQRDIAYVVVAPDNDFILQNVISFFKELSTVYELCRLGRHCPISKVLRDGIMRVGKSAAQKVQDEQVDEWFKSIGESPLAAKLKLYAQVCRHRLGPFLARQSLDKSLFDTPSSSSHKTPFKAPEPAKPPTPDSQNSSGITPGQEDNKETGFSEGSSQKDGGQHDLDTDDNNHCPAVVVYLIDPFTYGNAWDDDSRLAMVGLLRCYHQMVQSLPENLQNNMCLQVVPLKTILGYKESNTQFQTLKSVAFSVFTNCRWNLTHTIMGRPLTGFGSAAAAEQFLKKKEDNGFTRLYSPPFVLAPVRDKQSQLAECCGEKTEKSNVLFCAYCLSEDQRWLLATCTDERGELMETCVINIEIPNRSRRKKASARKVGLQKLFDYILGIVSMTTLPARLVIGRFGRLGHGELKGWAGIISKKNLAYVSKHMRDICNQCSYLSSENPSILSACLVSLEAQPSFQVMSDALKMEEKPSSNCPLQTPRDASTSHILVFPTSATAQVNSAAMPIETSHLELDDIMSYDEFGTMDNDFNFNELFGTDPGVTSPNGSPPPGDKGRLPDQRSNGQNALNSGTSNIDIQDEPPNLLQQPLAMGYMLSTAGAGPLPKWFWSASPENEYVSPTVFKAALHINSSSKQDDFMPHPQDRNSHALDSHLTCDVLRFVLEHYNALSWLTYDPATNDRRSCLPIHLVVLMQMYHALNAFV
ncbi:mediator of RNA polymerase II transcription subunit 13-like isoform X2 [Haliotis rufescens]|uniref:mediator of RNA polymerase II transcription subunit 13-like isoform X2 n=1 Tax=Haliotis rufescens TaxID=6454 RepID=UPI00201F8428|nr:mediator of RNA polymerase II transcription subunit 13-like isoform X2 [Haliotis rufescens]